MTYSKLLDLDVQLLPNVEPILKTRSAVILPAFATMVLQLAGLTIDVLPP